MCHGKRRRLPLGGESCGDALTSTNRRSPANHACAAGGPRPRPRLLPVLRPLTASPDVGPVSQGGPWSPFTGRGSGGEDTQGVRRPELHLSSVVPSGGAVPGITAAGHVAHPKGSVAQLLHGGPEEWQLCIIIFIARTRSSQLRVRVRGQPGPLGGRLAGQGWTLAGEGPGPLARCTVVGPPRPRLVRN